MRFYAKITIGDGGSTALQTVDMVYNVDMVSTVHMVYTVDMGAEGD